LDNVNARFYDENQQRIHKDLSDKVLTINIDEHSFINQPDHQTGRLIDDDFDDMQEDIRKQVEQVREDGLYDYEPVSPPTSHASDDSFDENEFLSETERDSPTLRSSQMFRRPDNNMSKTESEHEPASDKPANSMEKTRKMNRNMNGTQIRDLRIRTTTFLTCPLTRSTNQTSNEHTVKSPIRALTTTSYRHRSRVLL
jgi:hypothetical protein